MARDVVAERYIVIRNWERFQHYKDRRPLWVKNYLELLDDGKYLSLTMRQRGLLHGIWLAYAASRSDLGSSPARLGLVLGDSSVRARDLEALRQAGFIEVSASKPLAKPYQSASPEKEKEKETPLTPLSQTNGTYAGRCPQCGIKPPGSTTISEHLENVHGVRAA